MGRGNVCVTGPYEGLYYIDNDYVSIYFREDGGEFEQKCLGELKYGELCSGDWQFDAFETEMNWKDIKEVFAGCMKKRFKSLTDCEEWIRNERLAILENQLFYIAVEDNEWSYAIELLQKEDNYDNHLAGLQKKHFEAYLAGIRDALFEQFDEIGVYKGAWTSGRIERKDFAA